MASNLIQLDSFSSWAWDSVKELIKVSEPYQPALAAGVILGKLAWRIYKQKPLAKEIKALNQQITPLNHFIRSGGLERIDPSRAAVVLENRAKLQAELEEKRRQKSYAVLTFGQIPSLFFSHPGSNLYQGIHQLVGRGVQMRHVAQPVRPVSPSIGSRLKSIASLAGGLISMAGTAASIGRMTGLIDSQNRTSHILTYSAMGVHALEGVLMAWEGRKAALDGIATCYQWVCALPNRATAIY